MSLDIGIASYENPGELAATLDALRKRTSGEWRCLVVDSDSQDPSVRQILDKHAEEDSRIIPKYLEYNAGYSGAMNIFFDWAESEYIAYCDNDAKVLTERWNTKLAAKLDEHPEISMIFPVGHGTGSAYPIKRDGWTEVLWGVGCFWMLRRSDQEKVGYFDNSLGHQDEVDFQTRLRMAGGRMAVESDVKIHHNATASRSPEAQERINNGIINWVNKWCKIFTGELVNYHSENVIRYEDWPPNALYLEEFYKQFIPDINDNPEQVIIEGREYDLNRVPRAAYGGGTMYRGRII
jgi:GT2 family glycosyltransferase